MNKPTLARSAVVRLSLLVLSAVYLAACRGEVTSPPPSSLHAVDANKALSGVVDGVYSYTINPSQSQSLALGPSHLDIPAGAICDLASSGYGPTYWNSACTPQTATVTITATVRNAATNHPSVEFAPAMRFNPAKTVQLYLYVTDAATLSNLATVLYCGPFSAACVNEATGDPSLATSINVNAGMVSRRIKHFSGYVVAEFCDPNAIGGC